MAGDLINHVESGFKSPTLDHFWKQKKKIKQTCSCGRKKHFQANKCINCYKLKRALESKKPKAKRIIKKDNCECGNVKQITSSMCLKCYILTKKITIHYCKCGNKKSQKKRKNCLKCDLENKRNAVSNRTIQDYQNKNKGTPNAYVHIRTQARSIMKSSGIKKECKNCQYNKHVEVCHIKSIKDFDKNTLVKDVNLLTNLLYLCPNCHWEFDNGLLILNGEEK